MMLDPDDYEVSVPVQLTDGYWKEITSWAFENSIVVKFAYGRVYFKDTEEATLFKLRFGKNE
jgi:hypothetical protein